MAPKNNSKEPSNLFQGIFMLVICLLLIFWRGPGFVDDIRLFTDGETVTAVMERKVGNKQRQGKRARFLFYFMANTDTVRNESRMFEPLMAVTSKENDNFEQVFKVVYDPSDTSVNYPRATLRVHFFISLIILLIALFAALLSYSSFKAHFSR